MSLVVVTHTADYPESRLRDLAATLPAIVADALSIADHREGHVEPADVEVRFQASNSLEFATGVRCAIHVEASGLPRRIGNANERVALIEDRVAALGATDVGIWLTMPLASSV